MVLKDKRTEKRTETRACDCISRQAAIEHLKKRLYETEFNSTAEYPYYKEIADNRVAVWMNEVPTIEPDKRTETHACDSISRRAAIKAIMGLPTWWADEGGYYGGAQPPMEALLDPEDAVSAIENLPSVEPERLTDDDFETIRIHLNAYKEKLCNQQRWKEAEEYQRIIDRFMAFASAQPERRTSKWLRIKGEQEYVCQECGQRCLETIMLLPKWDYCPNCGAYMKGEEDGSD